MLEGERGKKYGRALVTDWEQRVHAQGNARVMTSTRADEAAQGFCRMLGDRDSGALLLPEQAAQQRMEKTF